MATLDVFTLEKTRLERLGLRLDNFDLFVDRHNGDSARFDFGDEKHETFSANEKPDR